MRVALSVDMEGVSQICEIRQVLACCPEYWESGKPLLEADVSAACEGLLAGGATEVLVLDNHGSGNPVNVSQESLPAGARLAVLDLFELATHGVDALLQVGYHARAGIDGFISHTYVPGLCLRLGDELISESHGRAWAAEVPLLGIVGSDAHLRTLGSLAGTPFLVVQETAARVSMKPAYQDPEHGLHAIRTFAERCARDAGALAAPELPDAATFGATMPNGSEVAELMTSAGWERVGQLEYAAELERWRDASGLLDAAMGAAFAPLAPDWFDQLTTAEAAAGADREQATRLADSVVAWGSQSQPEWDGVARRTAGH
jgi:D-amino peptidase